MGLLHLVLLLLFDDMRPGNFCGNSKTSALVDGVGSELPWGRIALDIHLDHAY